LKKLAANMRIQLTPGTPPPFGKHAQRRGLAWSLWRKIDTIEGRDGKEV